MEEKNKNTGPAHTHTYTQFVSFHDGRERPTVDKNQRVTANTIYTDWKTT